jgi:hypothetical protein
MNLFDSFSAGFAKYGQLSRKEVNICSYTHTYMLSCMYMNSPIAQTVLTRKGAFLLLYLYVAL